MLSIDVGFGNTKIYDGEEVAAFPSVYKEASENYEPTTDPDDQLLEIDGVRYHVGMTALKTAGLAPFDKEDMLRHRIFTLTAICAMTDGEDFSDTIALGLPIGDFAFMADKLRKEIMGKYEVKYNNKKVNIDIKGVKIYAQAEAVYKLLAKENSNIREKLVGIVDIGQKTVDFAYFNRGKFVKEWSGSMEQGVINAYQSIATAIEEKLGFEVPDYDVPHYLDRLPEDNDKAFSTMATAIKDRLNRKHWNFNQLDAIYIVGGGTSYIAPYFKDTPYKPIDGQKAVFANAYGYYEGE